MALNGVLPYFGSKREMAPEIVSHFRKHILYYEPFLGGATVLMAKEPSRQEAATDANPDVRNLLRCISTPGISKWLTERVQCHPLSERQFQESAERLAAIQFRGVFDMSRALDFLIVSWQGPSGLAGTTAKPRFAKRNTASGGSLAARWRNVAESIPAWHERLRNVEFRSCDGFALLDDVPDRAGVLVYCDPPYHPDTRTGGNYAVEFTREDHVRLAKRLCEFRKTQVVVSYRGCEELDRLYAGWDRHDIRANKKLLNASAADTGVQSASEVVYANH